MGNKKIKAVIIDDEAKAISTMRSLLADFDEIEVVGEAMHVDQGLELLLEKHADVVFLDINMPQKDGFELLHELSKYSIRPAIIFATAYDQFAIEAIRHKAFDYLLKPVDPVELRKVIRRYQCHYTSKKALPVDEQAVDQHTVVKLRFDTRSGYFFVHPVEIIYIKAEGNYSELYLAEGKSVTISSYLKDIAEQLPRRCFPRLGRSYIINMRYLKQVDRIKNLCILECNNHSYPIPISRKIMKTLEGNF